MQLSDPFGSAPDTGRSLRDILLQYQVVLPEGEGAVVLDLGADAHRSAGIEIAKSDFERVVGGLRLILRALDAEGGYIAAGKCFSEPFRLLRRLLARDGNLKPLRYARGEMESSADALRRTLGQVRLVSAELCRAAFRAFYEEQPHTDRLVSVCFDGGTCYVRAPFGATCREILQEAAEYPTPARIVAGDLLTGLAVTDPDAPLGDEVDALQLLTLHELPKPVACIRCGACMAVCPEGLLPWRVAAGKKTDLLACTDCGACTYACPALLGLAERITELRREVTA